MSVLQSQKSYSDSSYLCQIYKGMIYHRYNVPIIPIFCFFFPAMKNSCCAPEHIFCSLYTSYIHLRIWVSYPCVTYIWKSGDNINEVMFITVSKSYFHVYLESTYEWKWNNLTKNAFHITSLCSQSQVKIRKNIENLTMFFSIKAFLLRQS